MAQNLTCKADVFIEIDPWAGEVWEACEREAVGTFLGEWLCEGHKAQREDESGYTAMIDRLVG